MTSETGREPRSALLGELLRALGRTSLHNATFTHALAAQFGIGPTDMECLALLQELGPASAGQLAEVLSLTTGAITGVVDRLESAGFVARESDPTDRRRVIVRPNPERLAELATAYQPLLRAATDAFTPYSDDDLRLVLEVQRLASELMQRQTARLKIEQMPTSGDLSAPLGELTAASLEFATGASALRIGAHPEPATLYFATFEGPQPTVRLQDGNLSFRYRRMTLFDLSKHSGSVGLNSTIPWRIALRGGASNVVIDARDLRLCELKIGDGASRLEILLPPPVGTIPLCIEGGVNRVEIRRPGGVPVQLQVRGGANRLEFDGQRFGAVGGQVRLDSPGYELANDRYDIDIRGGASRLDIHES